MEVHELADLRCKGFRARHVSRPAGISTRRSRAWCSPRRWDSTRRGDVSAGVTRVRPRCKVAISDTVRRTLSLAMVTMVTCLLASGEAPPSAFRRVNADKLSDAARIMNY